MEKSSFCLERSSNGELLLRKERPYYYQCQLQMVATARPYCDFVVWRPEDCHIERVFCGRDFIAEKLKKGEELFWLGIVPELLEKWFTRDNSKLPVISQAALDEDDEDEDDDGTWCYCKEAKGGSMIGCENPSCSIKWFHMKCLRMRKQPKGKWFCPTCHSKK